MSENIKNIKKILVQFFKFGLIGILNTVISLAIYYMFILINENLYIVGSSIGWLVSVINSFFWNNRYVFKKENRQSAWWKSLLKTIVCYAGTGIILANILLYLWVNILGVNKTIAPLINLAITIPLNFILHKFWAFK